MDRYESLKLENQLCFPLYAAAREVVNLYTPYLAPLGLTYTQYLVFLVLWEEDDLTVGQIGERLLLGTGTLTPMLKKLENAGFISRHRQETDERVVRIRLTDEGIALRDKCADIPSQVGSCIKLSPDKAGALYQLLYEIIKVSGLPDREGAAC